MQGDFRTQWLHDKATNPGDREMYQSTCLYELPMLPHSLAVSPVMLLQDNPELHNETCLCILRGKAHGFEADGKVSLLKTKLQEKDSSSRISILFVQIQSFVQSTSDLIIISSQSQSTEYLDDISH